eukprot:TRINITY_DN25845_c0_g1_i1.p2 TRINITY_DN25845_c0_g1~~TRINITY_DN25845_c0_g1_i1.p2  ORF type:complete len:100 (-),score=9.51 TRINITY_DN25845_c0_g1_i1:15-293(-)
MDNARIHHGADTRALLDKLVEAYGVNVVYLPAYSPELNPCEFVFGYSKNGARKDVSSDIPIWQKILYRMGEVDIDLMRRFYYKAMFKWRSSY